MYILTRLTRRMSLVEQEFLIFPVGNIDNSLCTCVENSPDHTGKYLSILYFKWNVKRNKFCTSFQIFPTGKIRNSCSTSDIRRVNLYPPLPYLSWKELHVYLSTCNTAVATCGAGTAYTSILTSTSNHSLLRYFNI
jgi:hypothetical protein